MIPKQLPLQGLEHKRLSVGDDLTIFRRMSDSQRGSAWQRNPDPDEFPSADNRGNGPDVIIHTLGRFSILFKGRPLDFGRKAPQRPLALLKVLIALGGRGVSVSTLTSLLWPDVEGDTAKRSFDTTLFRLRKLFRGEPVLALRDGKVSLDSHYCWVDIWAFERLLGQSQRIRSKDPTGKDAWHLDRLMERILGLYHDHFLVQEDMTFWSVSLRERLRNKFIYNLLDVGYYWESQGFWKKAMLCYQKGLEVDDLVEVFYQRLMICCLETNRISEGMSVYRRCRQMLSVVLGLQPEPKTDSIYLSLRNARLQKQLA